jgi:hypothetical protein
MEFNPIIYTIATVMLIVVLTMFYLSLRSGLFHYQKK